MRKHTLEGFTDSLSLEMALHDVHVSIIEPANDHTDTGRNAAARAGLDSSLGDRSHFKEPGEVTAAVVRALAAKIPRRRYLVVPNEIESSQVVNAQIKHLVELNESQPYRYTRNALMQMLDEELAGACARSRCPSSPLV